MHRDPGQDVERVAEEEREEDGEAQAQCDPRPGERDGECKDAGADGSIRDVEDATPEAAVVSDGARPGIVSMTTALNPTDSIGIASAACGTGRDPTTIEDGLKLWAQPASPGLRGKAQQG